MDRPEGAAAPRPVVPVRCPEASAREHRRISVERGGSSAERSPSGLSSSITWSILPIPPTASVTVLKRKPVSSCWNVIDGRIGASVWPSPRMLASHWPAILDASNAGGIAAPGSAANRTRGGMPSNLLRYVLRWTPRSSAFISTSPHDRISPVKPREYQEMGLRISLGMAERDRPPRGGVGAALVSALQRASFGKMRKPAPQARQARPGGPRCGA